MFKKRYGPGPSLSEEWPCRAWDTPYGLCLLYDGPFSKRIMDHECSIEFCEEIAASNLPDANVSNLILNMRNYHGDFDLPREAKLKSIMDGLISIDNGIDVPVTAFNCGWWWWGLDGSFRDAEGIDVSVVQKWKDELPARIEAA